MGSNLGMEMISGIKPRHLVVICCSRGLLQAMKEIQSNVSLAGLTFQVDLRDGLSVKLETIEDIEIEKNEDYILDKN